MFWLLKDALLVILASRSVKVDEALFKIVAEQCDAGTQDFYNLVDVYMDAVLHPKCIEDERTFAQEGWHYELEDPKVDGRLNN